jgi:rhodanese-related sulfurtransferase
MIAGVSGAAYAASMERKLEITARELADWLSGPEAARPFLLDVRNPDEFAICQLPGATLVPLPELSLRLDEVPEDCDVVVYCHHGIRSLQGAAILGQTGRRAVSLRGGIDAWSQLIDPALQRY